MTVKRVQVILLPTNEAKGDFSKKRIFPCILKHSWMFDKEEKGKLIFIDYNVRTPTQLQHLYFLSDEEIKEGWYIDNSAGLNNIYQASKLIPKDKDCKKIIATTDKSLTINSPQHLTGKWFIPQPSQDFIKAYVEEYNKGNIIEWVDVEYSSYHGINTSIAEINAISGDGSLNWKGIGDNRDFKIKVNSKNEITIRKIKDSWNKEEVINIINNFSSSLIDVLDPLLDNVDDKKEFGKFNNKWISQNL